MRTPSACVLAAICLLSLIPSRASAARIDATQGRQYRITKQHGPWMIMVASLTETPSERRRVGISPAEAADQLVYALRKRKIPAYAFRLSEHPGNPLGLSTQASQSSDGFRYRTPRDSICVLAGNYKESDNTVAKRTLGYIKSLELSSLNLDWDDDSVFYSTPGQPKPFSGAFLTYNPLFTPEEIEAQKHDTLLLRMNAAGDYSIINNTGKFTLVVASFKGRSQMQIGQSARSRAKEFEISGTLNDVALRTWKVTEMLREGIFSGQQKGRTFEAYCFHDRYKSMVTVGAFDSPNDPRIAQLAQIFKAKAQTGANGQAFVTGESIVIPGDPPQTVIFDPVPRLIPVPKLR